MHKALHLRDIIVLLYVSIKKEEEDSLALNIGKMNQFKDSSTTIKRVKKDKLI